jgi:hypothetical protein
MTSSPYHPADEVEAVARAIEAMKGSLEFIKAVAKLIPPDTYLTMPAKHEIASLTTAIAALDHARTQQQPSDAVKAEWMQAIDIPKDWEGKAAWQWNDWESDRRPPHQTFIPIDFSRSPKACANVYFMLLERPEPPAIRARGDK